MREREKEGWREMKGLITFSRFKVIIVIIDICITTDDNNRFLRDYQKKKKKSLNAHCIRASM